MYTKRQQTKILISIQKISNSGLAAFYISDRAMTLSHSKYIGTVGSYRLLSTLLSQNLSVYGPYWQSNMHSTLDFCPRPARKETSVL